MRRRGGYPPPMDDREGVRAYFVLSLARSKVTVSFSVSPLRETVSVALSPAEYPRSALRGYSAGESATLTVSRSGETLKLTVTFDRASDSTK